MPSQFYAEGLAETIKNKKDFDEMKKVSYRAYYVDLNSLLSDKKEAKLMAS